MSQNWGIGRSYKVKLRTLHFAIRTKIDEIFIIWFNSIVKMEMCDLNLMKTLSFRFLEESFHVFCFNPSYKVK